MSTLEPKIIQYCKEFQITPEPFLQDNLQAVHDLFTYLHEHRIAMRKMKALLEEQKGYYKAVDKTAAHTICRQMRFAYNKYQPVEASLHINAPLDKEFSAEHIVLLQRMWSSAPMKIIEGLTHTIKQKPYRMAA